jgi:hypothetical protein
MAQQEQTVSAEAVRAAPNHILGSEKLGEAGRVPNPDDATTLAGYAMLARWTEAVPLPGTSHPAQPGSDRIGLFLHRHANGRFAGARRPHNRTRAVAGPEGRTLSPDRVLPGPGVPAAPRRPRSDARH